MTCFVAGDGPGAQNRLRNGGTAGGRFMAALCLAARTAYAPLRAYLRARSRRRAFAQFAAVDLHTLEDIGLLRTHVTAAWASEDNDNNPYAVARPLSSCTFHGERRASTKVRQPLSSRRRLSLKPWPR